jgi:predicted phage tail component-like protein
VSTRTVVTFDGHDLTADYVVSDLRTALLPRRIRMQEVSGRDGALYTGSALSDRTITLTLTARGGTPAERQAAGRRLAEILATDAPAPLAMSIDGGLYWMAVPESGGNARRYVTATSFEVSFRIPDPAAYGPLRTVTVPSGGSVTFEVGGTYPALPTVSASAAGNSSSVGGWRLALDDGSYLMATIPSGVSSAPVVADCAARTLTVQGNVAMLRPAADWLVLQPGTRTLTMTGTGAATVTFRERWL